MQSRRNFIKTSAITGVGITSYVSLLARIKSASNLRVGIIGLDTSHSIEFANLLNDPSVGETLDGYKVVAAYPKGSLDIKSSVERIAGYTEQMKLIGVEIVDSIDTLLDKADVVLLETNDGRRHLEQAIPVLRAGKRIFIDKPMAASLADAMNIFDVSQKYNIPIFSSSSLRFMEGMAEIKNGSIGKVLGVEAFSPAPVEKSHPDLFWYGIHGVEILFAAMGTGCKTVVSVSTVDTDVAIGTWEDGRIGTFRGSRSGAWEFGAQIFGENKYISISSGKGSKGVFDFGYSELVKSIVYYFKTGIVPVQPEETLEILAFMEAADESKKIGGVAVSMEKILERAREESSKFKF